MSVVVLEVLSGLGVGGAEKSFINRINAAPKWIETVVINTLPNLSGVQIPEDIRLIECPRYSIKVFQCFRNFFLEIKPEVVTVRSPLDLMLVALIKKVNKLDFYLVFEAHSNRITSSKTISTLLRIPQRRAIGFCNLVICASNNVSNSYQVAGAKNKVTHYFGGTSVSLSRKNQGFTILFVGRMVKLKNPMLLLKATKILENEFTKRNAKVLLIGTGSLQNQMQRYILRNDLKHIVMMLGHQSNLDQYYSDADFLVSTSYFEGLPLVFFEAKLNGLKVITTPSSDDFEILGDEDLVLKDFSLRVLVNALVFALNSKQLSESERLRLKSKNQWMHADNCGKKYYELLEVNLHLKK